MSTQEKTVIILYSAIFIILATIQILAYFGAKLKQSIKQKECSPLELTLIIIFLLPLTVIGVFFCFVTTYSISSSIFKYDLLLKHITTNIPNIIEVVYLIKSLPNKK